MVMLCVVVVVADVVCGYGVGGIDVVCSVCVLVVLLVVWLI